MTVESATRHHPHARAVLSAALREHGRPSHAYLFHGPPGAGKVAAARAFAAELLAEGAPDPGAVRRRVLDGVHPDLTWVRPTGAAEMLVSDVDEAVVVAATRTPFESSRRVFVIERAETMSDDVANRLLKTLEEPASYVHIVLLAARLGDVLPTVRSRCIAVRFEPLSPSQMAEMLSDEHGVEPGRALACSRLARGDARYALALASEDGEQVRRAAELYVRGALADELLDKPWKAVLDRAKDLADSAGKELVEEAAQRADALPQRDANRVRREAETAAKRAERRARTSTIDSVLHLSALWLRDVGCIADGAEQMVCNVDRTAALAEDAARANVAGLRDAVVAIEDARAALVVNPGEELLLESLAYRLQQLVAPAQVS